MNQDQITGILRAIIPALLAYVVGKGWIAESSIPDITAAVVAVVAAVWSVFNNTTAHKMYASIHETNAIAAAKKIAPTQQVRNVADALKAGGYDG